MSAENEIRNVQLFTNLISLKQDLFDSVHPVGEIYVQYPAQSDPNTIYNKNGVVSTWTEQNYAGSFFRASGGNADAFQSTGETSGLSKQFKVA